MIFSRRHRPQPPRPRLPPRPQNPNRHHLYLERTHMDLTNLSDAAAPASSVAVPTKAAAAPERELKPYEPMVHGESAYDRVSSMLMSLVIGASIIVGWLWLINFTNSAYASKTPPPVELIEVYGDGTGGAPDG